MRKEFSFEVNFTISLLKHISPYPNEAWHFFRCQKGDHERKMTITNYKENDHKVFANWFFLFSFFNLKKITLSYSSIFLVFLAFFGDACQAA